MGQYYKIVNLDRREFLHAHKFDDGLKLMEFGSSAQGMLLGLTVLLASGNGRGGGDFATDAVEPPLSDLVGAWAGDRIVIAGDYDDHGKWLAEAGIEEAEVVAKLKAEDPAWEPKGANLYQACTEGFLTDISGAVIELLVLGGEDVRFNEERIAQDEADRAQRIVAKANPSEPEPVRSLRPDMVFRIGG